MGKSILYAGLFFLIAGCSIVPIKQTKVYSQREYEIIKQREDFIKRTDAFLVHKMSKDVLANHINLSTLSKQMIFILPTNNLIDNVHYIINSENERVNTKFHLIDRMEYFYDKVNEELLIVYNLPFSYFLQNNLTYKLQIVGSLNNEIKKKEITFYFTYNFMEQPKYFNENTHNPSFKFVDFDDENLSISIKDILKEENKRINTKKFSDDYGSLYKKLENALNK